jgi:tetratricopeptide (TPR) repeat protein
MPQAPGESDLGRYRLDRLLGRGGMGEVYLAHDLTLDREVAIKFVSPDKVADPEARRRLLREARAAAALDHPGICTIHEAAEAPDGRAYIVMQYVAGEPLASLLQRGPLPARDALVMCGRIAAALAVAHERGIVHRDLKPANVMLTPSGYPTLVDFGLAKTLLTTQEQAEGDTRSATTARGLIVGTIPYMSPEQVQQRPLDGRSDLFSLGVILFECMTGRRPFDGPTPLETIGNILHVHPPSLSRLQPALDVRHDELCRRLLAKDPADRFQSAKEVVGAMRLLVPDTTRDAVPVTVPSTRRWLHRRRVPLLVGIVIAVLAGMAATWWRPSAGSVSVPPDADRYYHRGTEAVREGAYYTGSKLLETAVERFPGHALAYARLAEAHAELDNDRAASENLAHLWRLVPDPAQLPQADRARVRAVQSLVARDLDAAIGSYRELTTLKPDDAGAWLDLGRAQESADLRAEARASYQRAIAANRDYAPAYLRLGYLHTLELEVDQALAAFSAAQRLYQVATDIEGETEVLLRRGAMWDSVNERKKARPDLERARALASDANAPYQLVRARLSLSSVTASEGRFGDAERMASAAVQDALTQGLDTIAAEGLTDLAATLADSGRFQEAEAEIKRAIQLAERRGARRTAARARIQQAAIVQRSGRSAEALEILKGVLPFLKTNRYQRFELSALNVASRAHATLGQFAEARTLLNSVVAVAETLKDEAQIARGSSDLASVQTSLGDYPGALRLRERVEGIHRRQADDSALPYDLANRADLLIRLGRAEEAAAALAELDAGIAARIESYIGRARRARYLRAFAAVTALRCDDAMPTITGLLREKPTTDSTGALTPVLGAYCESRLRRRAMPLPAAADMEPSLARERVYWLAAAALERRASNEALSAAKEGLALLGATANDELRWRLAAVAAIAAQELGNASIVAPFLDTARVALAGIRAQWQADAARYEQRPDLAGLKRRAGLN